MISQTQLDTTLTYHRAKQEVLHQAFNYKRAFVMNRSNYTMLADLPLPESQAMARVERKKKVFAQSRERMFLDDE